MKTLIDLLHLPDGFSQPLFDLGEYDDQFHYAGHSFHYVSCRYQASLMDVLILRLLHVSLHVSIIL